MKAPAIAAVVAAIIASGALPALADQTFWTISTGAVPKAAPIEASGSNGSGGVYYPYYSCARFYRSSPYRGCDSFAPAPGLRRPHRVNPAYPFTPPRFFPQQLTTTPPTQSQRTTPRRFHPRVAPTIFLTGH